ncbi:MAG: hypothetical protein AB9866_26450 [Syntrophobacteraceae bacterium]
MTEKSDEISLKMETADYVASAAKAALGVVPFAGSLLAEVAGTIIPNQRIDRLLKFAEILDRKLLSLKQDFVRSQITNENFTDLLEEGLRQAARSLTDERREYISSVISNSLSSEDIEFLESKHLLRILNELSDIEVIWLRFHLNATIGSDKPFRQKHQAILEPISTTIGAPPSTRMKSTIQNSYKEHLVQLGLLEPIFESFGRGQPTPASTKPPRITGHKITSLGKLLLNTDFRDRFFTNTAESILRRMNPRTESL